jgi:hypothetical protein
MARMALNWLVLGASVGLIGNLYAGQISQIIAGMIAGMIVLAVPGLVLGLLGGDVVGSYVGAAGGFLGCWISGLDSPIAMPPAGVQLMTIFGALIGATLLTYLRTVIWAYGKLGMAAWRLMRRVPAFERVFSHPDRSGSRPQPAGFPAPHNPARMLARAGLPRRAIKLDPRPR